MISLSLILDISKCRRKCQYQHYESKNKHSEKPKLQTEHKVVSCIKHSEITPHWHYYWEITSCQHCGFSICRLRRQKLSVKTYTVLYRVAKTKTKNYKKRTPSSLYLPANTCQIVFRINHTSLKSITSHFKCICEVLSVQKCM